MRIDAHVHFWKFQAQEHQWMSPAMESIQRDFPPEELAPKLARHQFDGCVAVQVRQKLAESRYLLELSEQYDFIRGVVGWANLRSERVGQQLDEFAAHPRFKGVRHVVHDEPDDEFMLQADFQRGLTELSRRDLAYDLLIYASHLPVATRLVDQQPNQRFVLDHLGKPLIENQLLSPWRERIREIARRENVYCKISGLVTETEWNRWSPEMFTPYLEIALEAFGAERLMLASDWPTCNLSGDYDSVTTLWLNFISQLSVAEQDLIAGGVAERVYRL